MELEAVKEGRPPFLGLMVVVAIGRGSPSPSSSPLSIEDLVVVTDAESKVDLGESGKATASKG